MRDPLLPATGPWFIGREPQLAYGLTSTAGVFAARRRMGKSSLLLELARRLVAQGEDVLLLDFERNLLRTWTAGEVTEWRGAVTRMELFEEARRRVAERGAGGRGGGHATPGAGGARLALLVDEPLHGELDVPRVLGWIGPLAATAMEPSAAVHRVFLADHVEVAWRLAALRTGGSADLDQLYLSRVRPIGPLSADEVARYLALHHLPRLHEAAMVLTGGHPWLLACVATRWADSGRRRPTNELTGLWRASGEDGDDGDTRSTDAALEAFRSRHGLGGVLSHAQRRTLARALAAHLLRVDWPAAAAEERTTGALLDFTQPGDRYFLDHVPGTGRVLAALATGPLPREVSMVDEDASYTQDLLDCGYLAAGGPPEADARPVGPVDLFTVCYAASVAGAPGEALPPAAEPPRHAAAPLASVRPGPGGAVRSARLLDEACTMELTFTDWPGPVRVTVPLQAALHVVAQADPLVTRHEDAIRCAVWAWSWRFGVAPGLQDLSDYRHYVKRALRDALLQHHAREDVKSTLEHLFPRPVDGRHVVRVHAVELAGAAALARHRWPLQPDTAADGVDPAALASAWQAFLVGPGGDATPARLPWSLLHGPGLVAARSGAWVHLGCPAPGVRDWAPTRVRRDGEAVHDGNGPGATVWSPGLPLPADQAPRPRLHQFLTTCWRGVFKGNHLDAVHHVA